MVKSWLTINEVKSTDYVGKEVELRGWIWRTRHTGGLVFMILRDSSDVIQVVVSKGNVPEDDFGAAKRALVESSVVVKGNVVPEERAPGGYELHAHSVRVVHFAEKFPITKDRSEEFLLDVRHLWLRSREMTAALKVRSEVFWQIHNYFRSRGFEEFQSPTFVSGSCEGGSTLFEVPYFGRKVYLTQSWQLYAEAGIFGLERIYTIAPSFRAEKSRTRRHVTEFWHAEVEAAWYSNSDMMELAEGLITHLAHSVAERRGRELQVLGQDPKHLLRIEPPFPRMKYKEVLDELRAKGVEVEWGADLSYMEEKTFTEGRELPVFVTHYPREKGFYHRPDPDEPETLLCFDCLAPGGYGEIVGGGERSWELSELQQRIDEMGLEMESYSWYLDLRRYGSVPHSGFGLGIARTVAWLTGLDHISKVIAFPRTMRRVTP